MKTEIISAERSNAIHHALDVLQNGGLVAFPTDTVYGLAAPVYNVESIERLYVVKGRNSTKAIAVLLGSVEDLDKVTVDLCPNAIEVAARFWPGPLTLIVPRHPDLPEILAPLPTIGVRIPDHPVALALLQAAGPLAVTSANLSGGENTMTAQQVLDQLGGRIHLILDGGRTPGGVPSTVVDCTSPEPQVLRQGPISLEDIQEICG
ncbi:MAG TPA: threonylcarbamoyl-AMP synthase [Chloroflexi bacterium]|nr:threonylcarbamoyl-AMP synthase [Chloroflexota bacterium]HBY08401.1 threonylcarbamoyl-AMP synthase [Chloroflexota bacterium]